MSRKFRFEVILTVVCLAATACAAGTGKTSSDETLQSAEAAAEVIAEVTAGGTLEAAIETAPSEGAKQAVTEASSADDTFREALASDKKIYTLREMRELLDKQAILWEAYYNVSGERIDMYCEDGTELLFLSSGDEHGKEKIDEMILVMENDRFYKLGFQKGYRRNLKQSADVQYYPQTAEYYLSEAELMAMSQTDLELALHEIYARHGKRITEPFLQSVFSLKAWYVPKYEEADFVSRQDSLLNKFEKENVDTILAVQKKRGFVDAEAVNYKLPRSIVEGSNIDLDGDGLREDLAFDFMYAGPYQIAREYMVMINPKVPGDFEFTGVIDRMPVAIYAASLDGKTTQLIMSGKMNDGKPRTDIYAYQNGEARLVGRIDANNLEIMEDCFFAYQYDEQQITLERAMFKYENGTVIETGITEMVKEDSAGEDTAKADIAGDNRMRTLINSFDFKRSRIAYSEVAAALEGIGVSWESRLNATGERLDLICDDGTVLTLMETGLSEKELIMAGDRLSEEGFKRVFIHEQVAEAGEFYYPQTSEGLLSEYELGRMNQTELSIARNEIYARHGRLFADPFLHAVFSRKSWYKPKYDGAEFSGKAAQLFNGFEKENIMLLVEAEKKFR